MNVANIFRIPLGPQGKCNLHSYVSSHIQTPAPIIGLITIYCLYDARVRSTLNISLLQINFDILKYKVKESSKNKIINSCLNQQMSKPFPKSGL